MATTCSRSLSNTLVLAAALVFSAALSGLADDDIGPVPAPVEVIVLPNASDAARLALADLNGMQASAAALGLEFEPSYYRYVWNLDANPEDLALVSFVLNSVVNHSDNNFPPGERNSPIQFVAHGHLIRFDLFALAGNSDKEFERLAKVWDKIFNAQFVFEKEITAASVKPVTKRVTKTRKVTKTRQVTKQVRDQFNRLVTKVVDEPFEVDETFEVDEIIQEAVNQSIIKKVMLPHIDPDIGDELQAVTIAENPIVWSHALYVKALTQTFGGLYYEFLGIRKANEEEKKQGLTDQDVFLKKLGVSQAVIDNLKADQRALVLESQVTGKPRRVDMFNRPAPPGKSRGLITITHDMFDEDHEVEADPWLNLLNFKDKGREVIYQLNSAHSGYVLFDGNGNLVDFAPTEKLVADHEIPAPFSPRLEPGMSCLRCHAKGGQNGWKPFPNDVRDILKKRINIFDDLGGEKEGLTPAETVAKLVRLYDGQLDKPLRQAREDTSDAVVVSVGNIQGADGGPWQMEDVGRALHNRFVYHRYSFVDAEKALRELGFKVKDPKRATEVLNMLLGDPKPSPGLPIKTEEGRLVPLREGKRIARFQWDLCYGYAAWRVSQNMPLLVQQKRVVQEIIPIEPPKKD
jgi:hypothetical protein